MNDLRYYSQQFWHQGLRYLILFGTLGLFNQFIVIPVFRWLTAKVLQAGEIPFVSVQNTLTIIRDHPAVVVALICEVVVLLVIIYSQLAILLESIWQSINGEVRWQLLLQVGITSWQSLRPGSLLLILGYFLLVTPLAAIVFRTPLLVQIHLPQFIADYMTRNGWLISALVIFYVVMVIIGIRLILALPLMVIQRVPSWTAMKTSWQMTAAQQWQRYGQKIGIVLILSVVGGGILSSLIYVCQLGLDLLPGKYPFYAAVISLFVLQLGSELLAIWAGTVGLWIIIAPLGAEKSAQIARLENRQVVIAALLVLIVFSLGALTSDVSYLTVNLHYRPLTISHRGVAEKNGVQNTIPAMKKTSRLLHPDYVEMDVHETKDHQFVVLHDENLQKLTGVAKRPSQLTLRQLTKLTAHENGYQARLVSFDQYLTAAERQHQKLLVEIKTTSADSPKMVERFNCRYGQRLVKDQDLVHSLDYNVVAKLSQLNSRLAVFYVQPYDFGKPDHRSAGFSMEYSTLSQNFINQAHYHHQPVFAWTVNNPLIMKQMMYNHVDGIITDDLGTLNKVIADFDNQQSYARRILNYMLPIPVF